MPDKNSRMPGSIDADEFEGDEGGSVRRVGSTTECIPRGHYDVNQKIQDSQEIREISEKERSISVWCWFIEWVVGEPRLIGG